MKISLPALLVVALFISAGGARAQTDATDEPLTPDRPGFTNSSATVAPARVIVEGGFTQTRARARSGGDITDDFPETILRFGVTPNLELQLGAPNYNAIHGGARGFGDAIVGAKIKVYERGQTRVSLAPSLTVPFGRRAFRSSNLLPSILLGVDAALGKRAGVSANLIASETQPDSGNGSASHQFTLTPAASISYALTPRLGVFLDGYAIAPRRGPSNSAVDGGLTYLLRNDLQLDAEYGRGLGGGASPQNFFGGGIAVRF